MERSAYGYLQCPVGSPLEGERAPKQDPNWSHLAGNGKSETRVLKSGESETKILKPGKAETHLSFLGQEMAVERSAYGYLQCPVGSPLEGERAPKQDPNWSNLHEVPP